MESGRNQKFSQGGHGTAKRGIWIFIFPDRKGFYQKQVKRGAPQTEAQYGPRTFLDWGGVRSWFEVLMPSPNLPKTQILYV